MAKTIYALLVGIEQYQHSPALPGCVADATNVKAYLQEAATRAGATLKAQLLTNAQATRAAIVQTFLQHLGQAGKDDVALFYFSGHGALEGAHPAFKQTEKDDTLETLVCHDFINVNGLADKELRFLISKIAAKKPHVVVLTDCCFSGDSTRHNFGTVKQVFPTSQAKAGFAQRKWNEFIFANEITEAQALAASTLDKVLPQGNHIHFAACKSDELAFGFDFGGVFTTKLLEVLHQTSGNITYQELNNRLSELANIWYQDTAGNSVKQTPQIYVVENNVSTPITQNPAILFQQFLGGLAEGEPAPGNITYHANSASWRLDMGAVHGIRTFGLEQIKVDALNSSLAVLATAQIKEVFSNYSVLQFDANAALNKDKTYAALVKNVYTTPLFFTTAGNAGGLQEITKHYNNHKTDLHRANIFATNRGNILNAYRIVAQNNQYELIYAAHKLPVARQVEEYKPASANAIYTYLKHIARWEYVKSFRNTSPATAISAKDITLKVYFKTASGTEQAVVFDAQNKGQAAYAQIPPPNNTLDNPPSGTLKIALTNTAATTPYYCALAYLGQLFDIVTDTFATDSVLIMPGKTVFASGVLQNGSRTELIGVGQDAFIKYYNYPATLFGLLLVVSDKPISISNFEQEALPPPKTDIRDTEAPEVQERALPQPQKWASLYYEISLPNPYFKQMP